MLYQLTLWLSQYNNNWQVFQYISLRAILATLTALLICFFLAPFTIRLLQRLSFGQPVRTDGPERHLAKQGTPTMGGTLILFAMALATFLWANPANAQVQVILLVILSFGAIGLADDWLKVAKKNAKGLAAAHKYALMSLATLAAMLLMHANGLFSAELLIPYVKNTLVPLGVWMIALNYFVIVGAGNAVNLTDGLDGLAILPSVLIGSALGVFAYASGHFFFADYLLIPFIPGNGEIAIFCGALAGAGLGFLWFNTYPAQMFMGDVGALAIGGALGVIAVLSQQQIVFFIMSGVFVAETVSVVLQVASFKLRGKRIFRMAPLHHHFELSGWQEPKIIVRFWIITLILVLIGIASLKVR